MNDYKGKTFAELQDIFEEAIKDYGKKTQEEEARVNQLEAILEAKEKHIYDILSLVKTEHFSIKDGFIRCVYPKAERVWKDYEESIIIKMVESSNFAFNTNIATIISNTRDKSADAVSDTIRRKATRDAAWFFANNEEGFTPELMAEYWKELDEVIRTVSKECVSRIIDILNSRRQERAELYAIEQTWGDRMDAPSDVLSAAKIAWKVEHPLESRVGERVFCTTKGYFLTIESVDSKWVKFTNGEKCKRENVDLNGYIRNQDWYRNMERRAFEVRRIH